MPRIVPPPEIGKEFGRLTVIENRRFPSPKNPRRSNPMSLCLCKCGTSDPRWYLDSNLKIGYSTSCGCIAAEKAKIRLTRHGETSQHRKKKRSRIWTIWRDMRKRCRNKNHKSYQNYGARGIFVCERWQVYENFRDDILFLLDNDDTDLPAGISIDRVNNDGPYSPENVRLATYAMQSRNTRRNIKITINGVTKVARDWTDSGDVSEGRLRARLKNGWDADLAVTTSPKHGNSVEAFAEARRAAMRPYDFKAGDWKVWKEHELELARNLQISRIDYARAVQYSGFKDTRESDDAYMK